MMYVSTLTENIDVGTAQFMWEKSNFQQDVADRIEIYTNRLTEEYSAADSNSYIISAIEETIKRYKKKFWNKWCEFLVPKKAWYGFFYDFLWMFFRYELPAILVAIILLNPFFLLAGLTSAMAYAFGWALSEHKKTNPVLSECFSGFFAGLLLSL